MRLQIGVCVVYCTLLVGFGCFPLASALPLRRIHFLILVILSSASPAPSDTEEVVFVPFLCRFRIAASSVFARIPREIWS